MPHDARVTTQRSNTAPTALFLLLLCEERKNHDRDLLSPGRATGYELSALNKWGGSQMNENFLAAYRPQLLSLFRIMTGLLLFQFGVAKILKFPAGNPFEKAELMSRYGAAGMLELILGGLLIVGLFSRVAAFILAGEMAFAYFIGHMFKTGSPVWHPLFNGGTPAALFCFACLYLTAAGPGPYSLDATMRNKS